MRIRRLDELDRCPPREVAQEGGVTDVSPFRASVKHLFIQIKMFRQLKKRYQARPIQKKE